MAKSIEIEEVLRKCWGFDKFLPLQKEAMECVCRGRDSIVVPRYSLIFRPESG
jgi:hypothetical protein